VTEEEIPVGWDKLEEIGEELRQLSHERREVVQQIMSAADADSPEARRLYEDLDAVSGEAIALLQQQQALIRDQLNLH